MKNKRARYQVDAKNENEQFLCRIPWPPYPYRYLSWLQTLVSGENGVICDCRGLVQLVFPSKFIKSDMRPEMSLLKKIRGEFLFYHSEMISASLWHTASISNVSIMSTHNSAWEQCCNVTSLSSWGHIINNQHIPTYILSYISTRAPQFPLHLLTIYSKPWSCQSSRGTSASPGGLTNALETLRGIWNKVRKSNLLNSTSPTPCALIPYGCYHQHPAMHGH